MKKALDYYLIQGPRSQILHNTFKDFPNDIKEICEILHSLLVHPAVLHMYQLHLDKKRIADRQTKTIKESIEKIKLLKIKRLWTESP